MDDNALADLMQRLSITPLQDSSTSSDERSSDESLSDEYLSMQCFSDHLKMSKRFQKTFYYGELRPSNLQSPMALTDVTLQLFNKAVPNSGRLDILDMDYANSVSKAVCVSPYSMVLAMMYLEQLRHKNPDYLENVPPCDLFVVSILVASKYLFDNDDEFLYNHDWAGAANIDLRDLNRREREFLDAMNWELYTKPSDYFNYLSKVEQTIAFQKSVERGWLTYTDLLVLSQNEVFKEFWPKLYGYIVQAVLVSAISYAAAVSVVSCASHITSLVHSPARNFLLRFTFSSNFTPEINSDAFPECKLFVSPHYENSAMYNNTNSGFWSCEKQQKDLNDYKTFETLFSGQNGSSTDSTPLVEHNVTNRTLIPQIRNCQTLVINPICNYSLNQA